LIPRSIGVEVGNSDNMHPLCEARLRKEHRSKFSGADDGDRHRPAGCLSFKKFCVEIQGMLRRSRATET